MSKNKQIDVNPETAEPIWIPAFPLCPSVNYSLRPVAYKKGYIMNEATKKLEPQYGGRMTPTKTMLAYKQRCQVWRMQHNSSLAPAQSLARRYLNAGFQLRADVYVAFAHARVFSPDGEIFALDGSNRLKGTYDEVAKVLGIDDRHIFAGYWETTTTHSKDSECVIIKLTPMRPRTMEEILALMKSNNS